ncbi:hypothetical protein [Cognatitamlana onchidii]|uniref:hypothetical protein n=1 Tax=Cognatitamlana onchidii TaxID=2562860 RepID=UPI0010A5B75F|nr:hypothetical protein [Algibacter onchidii]
MKSFYTLPVALVCSFLLNGQTIQLQETYINSNISYSQIAQNDDLPPSIKKIESKILTYDFKNLQALYDNNDDVYTVTFRLPEGKAVASYDKDGRIVKTVENYQNVKLPTSVLNTILKQYPDWNIKEDQYYLSYTKDAPSLVQIYKIKLEKDNKTMSIKTNEKGDIL